MSWPKTRTRFWSVEDDATLCAFAEKCLPWKCAKGIIPGRSAAACETRWANKLRHQYEINPRKQMDRAEIHGKADTRVRTERSADGEAIYAGVYVFKVPEGDPLLRQLVAVHGRDTINRDMALKR